MYIFIIVDIMFWSSAGCKFTRHGICSCSNPYPPYGTFTYIENIKDSKWPAHLVDHQHYGNSTMPLFNQGGYAYRLHQPSNRNNNIWVFTDSGVGR